MENILRDDVVFKLRITRQKLALSWAPFVRPPRKGLGIKIDVWENPRVCASTRDWSSLYGAIYAIARNGHMLRDMGVGTSRHEDDQLPCLREFY